MTCWSSSPAPAGVSGGLWEEVGAGAAAMWADGTPPGRLGRTAARSRTDRLGWVDLPLTAAAALPAYAELRSQLLAEGMDRLVVAAMGGTGRSPRTLVSVLPRGGRRGPRGLEVHFLDSLAPEAVREALSPDHLRRTAFLIASKSGTTVETRVFESLIREALRSVGGAPGRQLLALSDPGSPLAVEAEAAGYRSVMAGFGNVGGRFSALSPYGLLPAVLAGCEVEDGLGAAREAREALDAPAPPAEDPGIRLGVLLARLHASGRRRAHLSASPRFGPMLPWLEQLFAENTGKEEQGILPVVLPPPPRPSGGTDRTFLIHLGPAEGEDRRRLDAAAAEGAAVLHSVPTPDTALGEIFRWQAATAVAAHGIGVNPYDEPDVEGAKAAARQLVADPDSAPGPPSVSDRQLREFLVASAGPGLAVNAFGHRSAAAEAALERTRRLLAARFGLVPAVGFGSSLLHSLGQLEKGGPRGLHLLMLTWRPREDLPIPPAGALPWTARGSGALGAGALARLQAAADYGELERRGRPALWLDAPVPGEPGLDAVLSRLEEALAA